jgi:TrmH family RNA methyltransferase
MTQSWKQYARLKQKKHREELGLFLVEGVRLCREALLSEWPVQVAYFSESFRQSGDFTEFDTYFRQRRIPAHPVSDANLKKLSDTEHPQGIVLVMKMKPALPEDFSWLRKKRFLLLLDGIRDPGDLGTILRAADWFGVEMVVTSPDSVDWYNPKVVRASMGAFFHVPFAEVADLIGFVEALQTRGIRVVATSIRNASLLNKVHISPPLAVVLGGEAQGVSSALLQKADLRVRIPRYGMAESLNVAVAGGIVLNHFAQLVFNQHQTKRNR